MKLALTVTPSPARFAPILLRGPVEDGLRLAAELSYDGVEVHLRQPGDMDRVAVRKLGRQLGLGFCMIGTGMAAGEDGLTFTDADPEVRNRAIERMLQQIDLAGYIGATVAIGLVRGPLGRDPVQRSTRLQWFLDCTDACCQAALKAGVALVIEPINRYETDFINTVDEALEVVHQVGSPAVKLLVDTFHMNIEEADIPASLRRAAPHLGHVHLVDSNRHVPGHGHTDMLAVLRVLHEVGYQGYLSFEALPLPTTRQAAEDGVRHVRGLLAQL
jgi:sugar phosphate isomerase/epimerase